MHITTVCLGNVCRSPSVTKQFIQAIKHGTLEQIVAARRERH